MAFALAAKPRVAGRAVLTPEARLPGRSVPHYGFFGLGCWCGLGGRGYGGDGHDAFYRLLAEDVLAVELGHLRVLGILLQLGVAGANLLFARVLGDAGLLEGVVGGGVNVLVVKNQRVFRSAHANLLAAGEDLVTAMLVIPLGKRGG